MTARFLVACSASPSDGSSAFRLRDVLAFAGSALVAAVAAAFLVAAFFGTGFFLAGAVLTLVALPLTMSFLTAVLAFGLVAAFDVVAAFAFGLAGAFGAGRSFGGGAFFARTGLLEAAVTATAVHRVSKLLT